MAAAGHDGPATLRRSEILGGWELVSFTARDIETGEVSYPLGQQPCGLIMYTDDGFMSAQLTRRTGPDTREGAEQSPDPGTYVAYGGRFHLDEASATIRHDVTISALPELFARPQLRHAVLEGDQLTLSATATTTNGTATHSTVVWRRAPRVATGEPRPTVPCALRASGSSRRRSS